ncbi:MAG: hypothetical protein IJW82_06710 [Clostridia bacterium]|nr:hypothetical protein [Clostridia bacterium]
MNISNELTDVQILESVINLCNQFNKKSLLEVNKITLDIVDNIVNKSQILNEMLALGRQNFPNCINEFLSRHDSILPDSNNMFNLTFIQDNPGEIFVITTLLLSEFCNSSVHQKLNLKQFVSNHYLGKNLSEKFNNFKQSIIYKYISVLDSMLGYINDYDRLSRFLFSIEPVTPVQVPQYTQDIQTQTIEEKTIDVLLDMVNKIAINVKNDNRIRDKQKYQIGANLEEILYIFEKFKNFNAFCFAFLPLKISLSKLKRYSDSVLQIEMVCMEYINKFPDNNEINIVDVVKNKARNYLKNF